MKKLIIIFVALILNFSTLLALDPLDCVTASTPLTNDIGGLYKPASGNLHVLLIFCQFPDDNYKPTNSYWQAGSDPDNMNGWIDETYTGNPTQGSLTHYFDEMSNENFQFTGECLSITTAHNRDYYLTNGKKEKIYTKKFYLT